MQNLSFFSLFKISFVVSAREVLRNISLVSGISFYPKGPQHDCNLKSSLAILLISTFLSKLQTLPEG